MTQKHHRWIRGVYLKWVMVRSTVVCGGPVWGGALTVLVHVVGVRGVVRQRLRIRHDRVVGHQALHVLRPRVPKQHVTSLHNLHK